MAVDLPSSGAPTIYDVAHLAGVSTATVSRVLNGHSNLRSSTRQRVLEAMSELKFVPNSAARGLSQGSKKIVGIAFAGAPATDQLATVEEESLLFTDAVVRGAEACASHYGYSLLLSSIAAGGSSAGDAVIGLSGKVDGLVLLDRVLPERRVSTLAKRLPVVLLAGSGRSRSAATVRVDNAVAMADLARHLVGAHHYRRLAFVSGLAASPDSAGRAAAFVAMANELGAEVEPLQPWAGDWTSAGAVRVTRAWLEGGGKLPEAIACANDQTALGVMHAVHRAGYRVPDDVAVVGFDDIPVARHLSPGLTTVRQPSRQLGAAAIETLIALVEGRGAPGGDIVLPTELQVRGSCGCPSDSFPALSDGWQVEV